ncbi:MAG: hypothetical protein WBC44_12360 [Planctomycetaceae bacterium]
MTSSPPTDDALERLLSDFFAREMPHELHALADHESLPESVDSVTAPTRANHRPGWKTALATLALVACGVLVAVISFPRTDTTPAAVTRSPHDTPSAADESPAPSTDDASTGSRAVEPLIIVDGFPPNDRRRANDRRTPVEQRNDGHWANAPSNQVPAGMQTDYSVPNEITVEILPLEGRPVSPRTPPHAPDDTRLPEQRADGR